MNLHRELSFRFFNKETTLEEEKKIRLWIEDVYKRQGLYSAYDCRCRIGLSEEIFVRRGYYSLVYCSSDSVESHSEDVYKRQMYSKPSERKGL